MHTMRSIFLICGARLREVPRAGFAAAQDDNGVKKTALDAEVSLLHRNHRHRLRLQLQGELSALSLG
jgi:hypothetical protein